MPRLMSVAMTKAQVYDRSKTVTRRAGWALRPGGRLTYDETGVTCSKVAL